MKTIVLILMVPLFIGCSNNFKAERVISEKENKELYELYLISNFSSKRDIRYKSLFSFSRKKIDSLNIVDSLVNKYYIVFYENCNCTRNYLKQRNKIKNVESLVERCENDYCGSIHFKRNRSSSNIWYVTYPKEYRDTIYCK